jgi:hypothetical protein
MPYCRIVYTLQSTPSVLEVFRFAELLPKSQQGLANSAQATNISGKKQSAELIKFATTQLQSLARYI